MGLAAAWGLTHFVHPFVGGPPRMDGPGASTLLLLWLSACCSQDGGSFQPRESLALDPLANCPSIQGVTQ